MRSRSLLLCFFFLTVLSTPLLRAQVPYPYDPVQDVSPDPLKLYHGLDIDSVDLDTGNLSVKIPLISYPQRGGVHHLNFSYNYSGVAGVAGGALTIVVYNVPHGHSFYSWQFAYLGKGSPNASGPTCVNSPGIKQDGFPDLITVSSPVGTSENYFQGWVLESDCSAHLVGWEPAGGTPSQGRSLDNTGFFVNGLTLPYSITSPNGVKTAWPTGTSPAVATDPNGNQMTWSAYASSPIITDTMGRQIPYPPSSNSWAVPGPNGGTDTFNFGSSGNNVTITLPNNTSYTLQSTTVNLPLLTGQTAAQTVSLLTKIVLPTGGAISYTYPTAPTNSTCSNGSNSYFPVLTRSVDANDGTGPHTWTYSYSPSSTSTGQTTVTDPLGNKTVYTYGLTSCAPYPTQVQYFDNQSNLLKTVTKVYSYEQVATELINVDLTSETTAWVNGQQSQVSYKYDRDNGFNFSGSALLLYNTGQVVAYYNQNNSGYTQTPFGVTETDYGNGSPGPVLRQIKTTFLAFSGPNASSYFANNLLNLPYTVQVLNGSGAQVTLTTYGYDAGTRSSSGVTTQRDTAPPNAPYFGNPTSVSRWLNTTGSNLTSTATFYDTGMTYQSFDPLNHSTTFSYSSTFAGAYPTTVTNPLSQATNFNYDFNTGLRTSMTDPNLLQTTFSFDNMWRLSQVNRSDGGQDIITHQEVTAPFTATLTTKINSTQNLVKTNVFDGLGGVTQSQLTSDPQGTVYKDTTYGALGRVATVSNPHRSGAAPTDGITTYVYDALGRTTQVTQPDGSIATSSYSGNTTTVTDEAGKKRQSTTDGLGRFTQVVEDPSGLGYVTNYAYDGLDNLTSVIQNGSRQRSFVYDSLSRLTSATNPESGTISYSYDANGNIFTKTAPAPNQTGSTTVTTTYSYDALNRVTQKSFSDGTTPTVKYGYDAIAPSGCTLPALTIGNGIGKRTGMCDAAGAEAWSYDITAGTGWKITDARTTNSVTNSTVVQNNLAGSAATLTYPSGRIITYTFDAAARPLSAIDSTGPINYATAAAYAPTGALSSLTNGASLVSTLYFNNRVQPCRISVMNTGTAPASCTDAVNIGNVLDFTYNFSVGTADNGNVTAITNNRDTSRSQSFAYDALNRISTAKTTSTSGTNCWDEQFGYDPWGNLLSIGRITGYTCSNEELLSVSATPNNQISGDTYDAAGNLITIPGIATYTYNAENQLTATAGVTYTYDGDGKRVQKSSGKLYWYGTGSDPLDETDLTGSTTNASFNEYIFFGGKRIARRDSTNAVNYYFADHLGTARIVANSSGTPVDDSDFYPFGGERVIVSSSGNNYKFTGKERDSESGLDNFGARYDSSSLGRFMSPDPFIPFNLKKDKFQAWISNPQRWNKYAYALNNPLLYIDPTGMTETIYYWLNSSLTDAQKKYFQEHKAEILNAIADKLKQAGIKDVVFKDGSTLTKSQTDAILAKQPKGVAFLNFANKSYAGTTPTSTTYGGTDGMRSAVYVGNLQSDNPRINELSFRISEVGGHELGHGMGFYSRDKYTSFFMFWNKDLMNEGQGMPSSPRYFDMSIPQNRQAVEEINKLPEYNPPK